MAKEREPIEKIAILLLLSGAIFFIFGFTMFAYKQHPLNFSEPINSQLFANFGSFIAGTVGLMWSLASILLFYITLKLQKRQISNQNELFVQERLETNFFNLLSYHHQLINALTLKNPSNPITLYTGKECFKNFFSIYREIYYPKSDVTKEAILFSFQVFSIKYNESLGSYFRNLYNIFKYIDSSSVANKKIYTNLIRAQLSDYELLLLYYNCLTPYAIKFFEFALRYQLYDNLSLDKLIDSDHREWYPREAFGDNSFIKTQNPQVPI